ncbi:MAG: ATP-dependent helicase MrfA [Candidatus Dormibacteria bacterium]
MRLRCERMFATLRPLMATLPAAALDPVARSLDSLRAEAWVAERIAAEVELPPVPARYAPWPSGVHPALVEALRSRGVAAPYSHQAEAIAAAQAGENVVVVTPTASGKSLCYLVPVLDAWLGDPEARSLWLFPTKALAQDQLTGLGDLVAHLPGTLRAATYDGDTPSGLRQAVRQAGHIVVTNPDMLHSGVLPHHTSWVRLFQQLRYVVIDELHAYRGVFGSHLANVLRRLLRLCAFYGSSPTIIACSATIANPRQLAERLIERPVRCIEANGAPRAARRIWFWNPPLVNQALGVRRSATLEARRLTDALLRHRLQTIAFSRSRASVEVLLTYLRRLHPAGRAGDLGPVRGYRGGYLPLQRRAIEAGLRDGSVRAVVSTNALELGIDIGNLDAAVLVGYPGSVASTWQQLGRAGRRGTTSLGVFIATDSPIDQFLIRHPEYLLEHPPEEALVNPDNLLVLSGHLQAATFELAFERGERFGTAEVEPLLECFAEDGLVHRSGNRFHWSADAFPAEAISLRRACATNVVIIDTSTAGDGPGQGPQGPWAGSGGGRPGSHGRVIGEVDQFSAPVLVHDDAIYLHEGAQFHVERLDWEEKRAYVHPIEVDHYTTAETRHSVVVLERYAGPDGARCAHSYGEVRVSRLATLYKKIRFLTHETVGAGPITLPEQDIHTVAYWQAFDSGAASVMTRAELETGLHGLVVALHQAACLLCMCDPRDLGTHAELRGASTPGSSGVPAVLSTPVPRDDAEYAAGWRPRAAATAPASRAGRPTVYLYDTTPGGIGLTERCHARRGELVLAATRLIEGCGCAAGCPSCVGPGVAGVDARTATRQLLELAAGD